MGRRNHVWFYKDLGWWVVYLNGRRVKLVQGKANRKLAEQKFHEPKAVAPQAPEAPAARVCDVVEAFLGADRPKVSAATMHNYDWYGQGFAERWGFVLARDLAPHRVITYSSPSEENQQGSPSIHGLRLHVLADGDQYDLAG